MHSSAAFFVTRSNEECNDGNVLRNIIIVSLFSYHGVPARRPVRSRTVPFPFPDVRRERAPTTERNVSDARNGPRCESASVKTGEKKTDGKKSGSTFFVFVFSKKKKFVVRDSQFRGRRHDAMGPSASLSLVA